MTKQNYFSKAEKIIWAFSVILITAFFLLFDRGSYLTLVASLLGTTSLIFCAKGNPLGQVLIIIFSLLYGYISYTFAYYGEMITYLGMSAPMAVISLISWLKNPYNGNRAEVKVNRIGRGEILFMIALTAAVTTVFGFILAALNTTNLFFSTFSVATSFIAVYLTFRRTPFFPLAYAFNDVVLIVLWVMAAMHDASYVSVIVCFIMFLVNDIYGFISWLRMEKRQKANSDIKF